ncbi:MAG: H-type small acid-soluble spore protein [Thermacetogeniaceae bacterium]
MNIERAQEIFDSYGVIEVLHRGAPVWIEAVANDLATVKYLDSQERTQVPVADLVENETGAW